MSSIVTSILSSTVGLLWNKVQGSNADKLKDRVVTDTEIRNIVLRKLDDIKSKSDGLSRTTLLASLDFLREGVALLHSSLDKSDLEQRASETQDKPGEALNQAVELPRAMEKLQINSDGELETARKSFEKARETATTAFWNEAFTIEDRIFAAKLRIVSEILEHLDSPEAAFTGCLSHLQKLHSLPAIQELFSEYLNGGVKSLTLLNNTQRVQNVKSVMLINYVLFQYVWKFSNKYSFEVSACMPTIELLARGFHPIINWYEISTRKSLGGELPDPQNRQLLDEKIRRYLSAVNSRGDVFTFFENGYGKNITIILKTEKIKQVELPEFRRYFPVALAVSMNNNVYVVRRHFDEGFILTILDENCEAKAEHKLDFLGRPKNSSLIRIAVYKDSDIIIIRDNDPHVYVCEKAGQLKFKFERDSISAFSLSISQQNEILITTDNCKAVQIYTKKRNLKTTVKVPEGHTVMECVYVIGKILVLTWAEEKDSYFILCYSEAGEELETFSFFGSGMKDDQCPKLVSHPNGPVVFVRERSIIYL